MRADTDKEKHLHLSLLISLAVIFAWSLINPRDILIWLLEVFPVIIGLIILTSTYRRFKFTPLAYILMWVHAIILIIGGHYTYSEMPLFNWIRDTFELSRNHYDRVGHIAQGVAPAIIARELLLRLSPLGNGKWLFFIVTSISLAISAFYEFIEWWVAVISDTAAEAFLALQGDIWDTQWDMFLAFSGAIVSQLIFGRLHNRQVGKKQSDSSRSLS